MDNVVRLRFGPAIFVDGLLRLVASAGSSSPGSSARSVSTARGVFSLGAFVFVVIVYEVELLVIRIVVFLRGAWQLVPLQWQGSEFRVRVDNRARQVETEPRIPESFGTNEYRPRFGGRQPTSKPTAFACGFGSMTSHLSSLPAGPTWFC